MNIFKPADPLVNLFKTKGRIENEISELKSKIFEAERALANCTKLEQEMPDRIAQVRARVCVPFIEDVSDNGMADLAREVKIVRAFERLQKDLPAIRAHWEKRLNALAA